MLFGKLLQEVVAILQVVYLANNVAHHFCLEVSPSIIFKGRNSWAEKDGWCWKRINFTAGSALNHVLVVARG